MTDSYDHTDRPNPDNKKPSDEHSRHESGEIPPNGGNSDPDEPVAYPITGELDLHIFPPSEVRDLVPEYLRTCREKEILTVRIIHGKGTGALRRLVHAILEAIPWVNHYHLGGPGCGTWGATIAYLDPPPKQKQ